MNFRMKNREVKREKTIDIFVNSAQKINIFYTLIYTITKKIFTSSQKNVKWEKNVYIFLIKKHLYMLG